MTMQFLSFKTERDLVLILLLSVLFVAVIAFFPDSPVRIILGSLFILFFPGYVLISALFPQKDELDVLERLALSLCLSVAVTALIGLALTYTSFGIWTYTNTFSLFLSILLMSALAMYRRRTSSSKDVFAPLSSIRMNGWRESEWLKSNFKEYTNEKVFIKIVALICFLLLIVSQLILLKSPATGYESSIYTAIPPVVWIFLIVSSSCGFVIAVYEVYQKNETRNKLWVLGFLLIMLATYTIMSLPYIKGYFLYGSGDVATHYGFILTILSSGHIGTHNFYPILHMIIAQVSQVLDITPLVSVKFVLPTAYVIYTVFIYLFARTLLSNRGSAILATLVGLSVTFGSALIYPCGLAFLFIPCALYLFCKSNTMHESRARFTFLFVIMLFLFPAFHPIPAVALIILLLTIGLSTKVPAAHSKSLAISAEGGYKFNSTATLLLVVWFITWISSFYVWEITVRNTYSFLTEGGSTNLDAVKEQMVYAKTYGYSVWAQFFKRYATTLVLVVLSIAAFPVLIKRKEKDIKLEKLFVFYAPLFFLAIFVVIGFSSNIVGLTRLINMMNTISCLFAGFLLYEGLVYKYKRNSWRKAGLCGIMLLLIIVYILSLSAVHSSPYLLTPNDQVTHASFKGMDWFFNSKIRSTSIISLSIGITRFASMIPHDLGHVMHIYRSASAPPYHFGYPNSNNLGDQYGVDQYMVLSTKCRVLYTEVWPEIADLRFLPRDFEQLEDDASVDKLYSNGGFDAYYIHARFS